MKVVFRILLSLFVLMTGACGQSGEGKNEEQAPAAANDTVHDAGRAGSESFRRGKIAFLKCRSCHTLKAGGTHMVGPNLHGLIGAAAGRKEGYPFSAALSGSNIIWNESSLDSWIKSPGTFAPGNRMVFAGIPREQERRALIEYLTEETR